MQIIYEGRLKILTKMKDFMKLMKMMVESFWKHTKAFEHLTKLDQISTKRKKIDKDVDVIGIQKRIT